MTGLLDRLRAWFGVVLGGGAETDDDTPNAPESDAPDRRVVHRDDRPLETPSTMDRPAPPSASTPARPARVEVPDAEAEADVADRPAPKDVSIPDAEATTPTDHDGGAGTPADADSPEPDAAVACSVCGTTVDDPSAPCPLCRSTDVVPVADAPAEMEEETPAHSGHTAVSTGDDDAVERLRDVREGE